MSRRRPARSRHGADLDLFPALGLFVCVLGIMALFQAILSTTMGSGVSLVVHDGRPGVYPIKLVCRGESLEIQTPIRENPPVFADAAARREYAVLLATRKELLTGRRIEAADRDHTITTLVRSMAAVNALARRHAVLHEESLILAVYPGSAACFHEIHAARSGAGSQVRASVIPFDAAMELAR